MNNVPPSPPSAHVMAAAQDPPPEAAGPSMRRFVPQMSVARRQQIIDEARAAGRLGLPRLPDSVLMESCHADPEVDPTDSMILERLDAHELGLRERGGST